MTIAEKILRAKEDYDAVYEAGKQAGGGIAPEGDTLTEFLKVRNGKRLFSYNSPTSADVLQIHESLKMIPVGVLTDCTDMFYGCSGFFSTVPMFDTSNVIYMYNMFFNCSSLKAVPLFNTSKVVNMAYMFYGCRALTDVPLFDTSNVSSMSSMFRGCTALTTVPLFNTSKATSISDMFSNCSSLTSVPAFDVRNASLTATFSNTTAITEIWIINISDNLTVGSGTSYGHLLTVDSLVHLIYELREGVRSRTLTVGAANLAKLADVYVKLVDITDEMRAEDDLIDEKLPFVRCESTDEGAMLISEYVTFKNWALK